MPESVDIRRALRDDPGMPARAAASVMAFLLATCAAAGALEVRTFTASEQGFLADSYLILGDGEALLVDAQFTLSEAWEVVRMIEDSGRTLTAVFITCSRPEHYFGLEVVAAAFPRARILARPATVAAIADGAADAIARWQPIYLDDVPATLATAPEPYTEDVLTLAGAEIRLVDAGGGMTALYLPAEAALVASDVVLGGVHPWPDETDLAAWRERLEAVRGAGPIERVYPGRGTPGDARLLEESARYLTALTAALGAGADAERILRTMTDAYPDYRLPILLEQSLRTARGRRGDDGQTGD